MDAARRQIRIPITGISVALLSVALVAIMVSLKRDEREITNYIENGVDESETVYRSSIRELNILPRRTVACALPYSYATYKGKKSYRHGWQVRIQTLHTCIDCPVGPGCTPGVFSWMAIVQPNGAVTDSEFATIFSAGPGDDSEKCDGFDNYQIRWEEAMQLKKYECGKMHNFRIQYPIVIKIRPEELISSGLSAIGDECVDLEFCNLQGGYVTIYIYKNDSREREVVIPFYGKE